MTNRKRERKDQERRRRTGQKKRVRETEKGNTYRRDLRAASTVTKYEPHLQQKHQKKSKVLYSQQDVAIVEVEKIGKKNEGSTNSYKTTILQSVFRCFCLQESKNVMCLTRTSVQPSQTVFPKLQKKKTKLLPISMWLSLSETKL